MTAEGFESIWTPADDAALARCLTAVDEDDLAQALLAVEGADRIAAATCRGRIRGWGRVVRSAGVERDPVRVLAAVLVGELGLRGDEEEYDHPDNSFLSRVAERRRGLPILVSAIWMLVGRAAGVRVEGVALPGHFIVSVHSDAPGQPARLADPFHGGRELSVAECRQLVQRLTQGKLPWRDEYLEPSPTRAHVARVLRNLLGRYHRTGDQPGSYRIVRFLAGLQPGDPELQLLHAQLAEQHGAFHLAQELLEGVRRRFGGSPAVTASERLLRVKERVKGLH